MIRKILIELVFYSIRRKPTIEKCGSTPMRKKPVSITIKVKSVIKNSLTKNSSIFLFMTTKGPFLI